MDKPNKVRIEICGSRYVISSPEPPEYVKRLANEIEDRVQSVINGNSSATLTDAYLLTLLSYADLYEKSEQNADHIRGQLTEYLEDAARARIEADESKREIDKLRREVNLLRQNIGREH